MKWICLGLILIMLLPGIAWGQVFFPGANYGQPLAPSRPSRGKLLEQPPSTFSSGNNTPGSPSAPATMGLPRGPTAGFEYQVHVLGQVSSPGTYRVDPSVRVAELGTLAGGITPQGSSRHIELRNSHKPPRKVDLFRYTQWGDLSANPFIEDNDVVMVPFRKKNVRIEGPVKNPGVYELVKEESLWDVVQLGGGFTTGVTPSEDVVVIRYQEGKKTLAKIPSNEADLRKTAVEDGDVLVVPHLFTKGKEFDYNIDQLPGDNVFYPSLNDNVYVIGAVAQPGPYSYRTHFSVREYVNMAGPTTDAKVKRARVVKPDGKVARRTKGLTVSPGDTIVVPEKRVTFFKSLAIYNAIASSIITGFTLNALLK